MTDAAPQPSPIVSVRPMRAGERPYVVHSWSEGFKDSPRMRRKVWRDYKVIDVPRIDAAMDRTDTSVLMATVDDRPIGYVVFARWPSIDAVHWLYVRRRSRTANHAVPDALLTAAALKPRLVYTHEAAVPRSMRKRDDQRMAEWLRGRGSVVSYIPFEEWAR